MFVEMFLRKIKEEFSSSIISPFLKRYYTFYENLIMKRKVALTNDDSSDANISENSLQDLKEVATCIINTGYSRERPDKTETIACGQLRNEYTNSLMVNGNSKLVSILSKSKGSKPKKSVHFNSETIEKWEEKHKDKEKSKPIPKHVSFENPYREAFKQSALPPGIVIRNPQ
eukprot:TRINITY_DN6994_c0_g1_i13.p1 TRINITY_DN6994_c0_g1~~TRINITY_DN6994_c0_g1_i13.p1  ORF type:complete len:172 (-),score=24.70 TRINITY_DN6994_c0_g1_i13:152-667(-)